MTTPFKEVIREVFRLMKGLLHITYPESEKRFNESLIELTIDTYTTQVKQSILCEPSPIRGAVLLCIYSNS